MVAETLEMDLTMSHALFEELGRRIRRILQVSPLLQIILLVLRFLFLLRSCFRATIAAMAVTVLLVRDSHDCSICFLHRRSSEQHGDLYSNHATGTTKSMIEHRK